MIDQSLAHASGAILGALAGDAAGAVLEFLGRVPSAHEVEHALSFPGGGSHRVAPGQATDDGELTLAQLRGLARAPDDPLPSLALAYAVWIRSSPFDVGMATGNGLAPGRRATPDHDPRLLAAEMTASARRNIDSKANGSLMRSTPLGVWGARRTEEEIVAIARADSALTHPNPACTDAVACYALAISHLIANAGDREGAFRRAELWVTSAGDAEVAGWLRAAAEDRRPTFYPMAGFVRIGFTEAFRHLRLGSDWTTAVTQTLLGGGDTDTNACIVGGLIGAAVGRAGIPAHAIDAVLESDHSLGRPRPEWLHPRNVEDGVRALLRP